MLIQQFVCHLPRDAPAFYTLRAGLLTRLSNIRDDDFQAVVLVTQEVLDLDNLFCPTTFHDPRGPRNNRQSSGFCPQQPQNPPASSSIPNGGQNGPHDGRRDRPSDTTHRRDDRKEDRRGQNSFGAKRDDQANNRHTAHVFLADTTDSSPETLLPSGGISESSNLENDWSAEPSSSIPAPDPMVFLASGADHQINEDLSNDFYDHFSPQSYATLSPALSEALALISVSPGPVSKLNTVLDSGSTHHIVRDRSFFQTYDTSRALSVKTANCGALQAKAMGDVALEICLNGRKFDLLLLDCLHAPDVPINLFSVGVFQEGGFRVLFEPGDGAANSSPYTDIIFPGNHSVLPDHRLRARFINRLSFLSCTFRKDILKVTAMPAVVPSPLATRFPKAVLTPSLWHRRLGHPGHDVTKLVLTKNYVTGADYSGPFDRDRCVSCLIGKSPQRPFSNNGNRATRISELLHIDICGPFPTATPNGKKYFINVLDDCSNVGFTSLLAARLDAFPAYLEVEAHLELVSGHKVLTVRLDNAPELVAGDMGNHFKKKGIIVQAVAPYAHAQNGKAERYIRTLEDGMQTLLADSGLPATFWGDAVLTMQYLRNRLPTSTLPADMTPYKLLYGKKPNVDNLRIWGCQCFAIIPPELRDKGGPRCVECIFVGYHEHRLGWRVRDIGGKYHFSRDVIFNESLAGRLGKRHPPASSNPVRDRIRAITGVDYSHSLDLVQSRHISRQQTHGSLRGDGAKSGGNGGEHGGGQVGLDKDKGSVGLGGVDGDAGLVKLPLRRSS